MNLIRRNHWIWLGPLVVFAGAVSYFLVFVRFPVLRDFPWLNLPLVILGALMSFAGLWVASQRPRDSRWRRLKIAVSALGLVFALGLTALFGWYIFDFSYRIPEPVSLAGQTAPDFALTDGEGKTVQLTDYRGEKVLLVFFRGHW